MVFSWLTHEHFSIPGKLIWTCKIAHPIDINNYINNWLLFCRTIDLFSSWFLYFSCFHCIHRTEHRNTKFHSFGVWPFCRVRHIICRRFSWQTPATMQKYFIRHCKNFLEWSHQKLIRKEYDLSCFDGYFSRYIMIKMQIFTESAIFQYFEIFHLFI